MLWFSGAGGQTTDGTLVISPGKIQQKVPGTTIDQTDIKYDQRGWEAVKQIQENIDEITGITPTLQGETTAKTLGQSLQDKEGALKKLSIPLKNIAQMLEDEAFISLSWMKQIYSIPEIKKFANEEEIQAYVDETGRLAQNVIPNYQKGLGENGQPTEFQADFYPQLEMALEDREGVLVESKENRFFNVGTDIPLSALDWDGMIEVKMDSMLSPTPELERQRKLELFNLLQPVIAQIAMAIKTDVDVAIALGKPAIQILEIQNEKPKLWLPDELILAMENPQKYKEEQMAMQQQAMQQDAMMQEKAKSSQSIFLPKGSEAPKVVGEGAITNPVKDTLREMGKVR